MKHILMTCCIAILCGCSEPKAKVDNFNASSPQKAGIKERFNTPKIEQAGAVSPKLTPAEVSRRVKAGEVGQKLAKRARLMKNLSMSEVKQNVVDLQIFYYSDNRSGVNLLFENGKLILLCAAWGSGPVSGLKFIAKDGKRFLRYTYTMGSGISHPCTIDYELGTGKGFSQMMVN
jgi:hypothetical protein